MGRFGEKNKMFNMPPIIFLFAACKCIIYAIVLIGNVTCSMVVTST